MPAAESVEPECSDLRAKRTKRRASPEDIRFERRKSTKRGDDRPNAFVAAASKLRVLDQEICGLTNTSQLTLEVGECVHDQQGMTTFFAFLRGVNVGSHNRLPMARLRALLSDLGFGSVRTHLQSGNAVFTAPADTIPEEIEKNIQARIKTELHLTVAVLVRSKGDVADVIWQNPLKAEARKDGSKFLVLFLSDQVDVTQQASAEVQYPLERVAFGRREVYIWCPNGVAAAKHGPGFWEKRLGAVGTARNWNTVTKLLEMAGG